MDRENKKLTIEDPQKVIRYSSKIYLNSVFVNEYKQKSKIAHFVYQICQDF